MLSEATRQACIEALHDERANLERLQEGWHVTSNRYKRYMNEIHIIDAALAELEAMPPAYAHRNGETDPPTHNGWYWFWENEGLESSDVFGTLFLTEDNEEVVRDTSGKKYELSSLPGKWWGPVTPPWEER